MHTIGGDTLGRDLPDDMIDLAEDRDSTRVYYA